MNDGMLSWVESFNDAIDSSGLYIKYNVTMLCTTDLSLALDGWELNGDAESAAGGKQTGYLDLAKKGGGHKGNSHNSQLLTKKQNLFLIIL